MLNNVIYQNELNVRTCAKLNICCLYVPVKWDQLRSPPCLKNVVPYCPISTTRGILLYIYTYAMEVRIGIIIPSGV